MKNDKNVGTSKAKAVFMNKSLSHSIKKWIQSPFFASPMTIASYNIHESLILTTQGPAAWYDAGMHPTKDIDMFFGTSYTELLVPCMTTSDKVEH